MYLGNESWFFFLLTRGLITCMRHYSNIYIHLENVDVIQIITSIECKMHYFVYILDVLKKGKL